MSITTPQKAIRIIEDWLDFYPANFTDVFVIVPDQKRHFKLSTPLFWYAFYSLKEEGKLLFEEPLFITVSKPKNGYNP